MDTPLPLATPDGPKFPVTPEAFWTEFSRAMRNRWSSELEERYEDAEFWTPFMTELLRSIGFDLGLHPDCEFWPRVDISYFSRCGGDEWGSWSREVAIEHEGGADWTHELCKLIEINAGLKVLIAYPERGEHKRVLDQLPAVYASRKYVTSPCNYLLIFGPCRELPDFVAFSFDGRAVVEITSGQRCCAAFP